MKAIISFFIQHICLQGFLTLVLMPLYAYWGIPFTLLSILGNILFLPFLFFLITLGILIIICTLISVSPFILIYTANTLVKIWILIMESPLRLCNLYVFIPHTPYNAFIIWGCILPGAVYIKSLIKNHSPLYEACIVWGMVLCSITGITLFNQNIYRNNKNIILVTCDINLKKYIISIMYKNTIYNVYFKKTQKKYISKKEYNHKQYIIDRACARTWGKISPYKTIVIFR